MHTDSRLILRLAVIGLTAFGCQRAAPSDVATDVAHVGDPGEEPPDLGEEPPDLGEEPGDVEPIVDAPDDPPRPADALDAGDPGTPDAGPPPPPPAPAIDNLSGSDDAHVQGLVAAAIEGLGFAAGGPEGPRSEDRFFCGRYYLAWLDQTGFVGKMNALWRLNGADGHALDFAVTQNGRPVSFFIVGEGGLGQFPPGYPGAEHTEFPSRTPEPNDDPGCADKDWCNQYAHDEAATIADPDIPWWSACNAEDAGWDALHLPIEEQPVPGGLRLVWEAPLVKEADGDGTWDGDACHEDWLFEDGIRRPVYLQVGYELFGDAMHFDRTLRFRNPAGNPPFDGPMSVIGGFVITSWPDPHPLKAIDRWLRPADATVTDTGHSVELIGGQWTNHMLAPTSGDEVLAWLGQPFSMSAFPTEVPGRTATLSHIGPSDNDDVGICLCKVHGAIEMGGGLLHGGISLPVAPGATSIEARRRLALPGDPAAPSAHVYQAETDLSHAIGKAEEDGWAANTAEHEPGHLVYGPWATDWTGATGEAVFTLMVDNVDADDQDVVVLDVFDATLGEVLATRAVSRQEFTAPWTYQPFGVEFDLTSSIGHTMEVRAWWTDVSYTRIDAVAVTTSD